MRLWEEEEEEEEEEVGCGAGGVTLTFMLTLAPTTPKDSWFKTSAQESIVADCWNCSVRSQPSFYYNVHSSCCMRAQHSSKGHGCP